MKRVDRRADRANALAIDAAYKHQAGASSQEAGNQASAPSLGRADTLTHRDGTTRLQQSVRPETHRLDQWRDRRLARGERSRVVRLLDQHVLLADVKEDHQPPQRGVEA